MLESMPDALDITVTSIIAIGVVVLTVLVGVLMSASKTTTSASKMWASLPYVPTEGPRSARWLALQWLPTRTPVPHIFRSSSAPTGLRPLDPKDWIEHEPRSVFEAQVTLKRKLLQAEDTRQRFWASLDHEETVIAAEAEVLAMLLDHVETHLPEHYRVDRDEYGVPSRVTCLSLDAEFAIDEYASCPLRLAGMLVQEDFIILSPEIEQEDGMVEPSRFVSGCACFSFMEIGIRGEKGHMKVGETVNFIHTPVPGFNEAKGVGPKVTKFFKHLETESPLYRTNWLLVAEQGLSPMRYDLSGGSDSRAKEGGIYLDINNQKPQDLHLRVELQSVRRLPKSRHILFTLHCYSDPLPSLKRLPKGAAVLRQALIDLDPSRRRYRGMGDSAVGDVAAYLAGLAGGCV